jgi:hypothetical protein
MSGFTIMPISLKEDCERLEWLIENEAYVRKSLDMYYVMTHVCEDEFETLGGPCDTAREAIDDARHPV